MGENEEMVEGILRELLLPRNSGIYDQGLLTSEE